VLVEQPECGLKKVIPDFRTAHGTLTYVTGLYLYLAASSDKYKSVAT
jgi:hypothetical protein